jgi:hypothetical protein
MIRYGLELCLKLVTSNTQVVGVKQFFASFKFVSHGFDPAMVSEMLVLCCIGPANCPRLHLVSKTAAV